MQITKLEDIGRRRYKIYIDEDYAFMLYNTDIRSYALIEGKEIDEQLYETIMKETITRRARQKALAVLKRADKTEAELRRRLSEDLYNSAVIEDTIQYIKGYHYIDDKRYAENYIYGKKAELSERGLIQNMIKKGISKDIIEAAMSDKYSCSDGGEPDGEQEEAPETEIIIRYIERKTAGRELNEALKRKIWQALYRKGFNGKNIKRAFNEIDIETEEYNEYFD